MAMLNNHMVKAHTQISSFFFLGVIIIHQFLAIKRVSEGFQLIYLVKYLIALYRSDSSGFWFSIFSGGSIDRSRQLGT